MANEATPGKTNKSKMGASEFDAPKPGTSHADVPKPGTSHADAPKQGAAKPGTPKLVGIEQICDGWIKKYIVHYELPDGRPYQYDCASRKGPEEFRHGLEANSAEQPPATDAVCIVPQLPDGTLILIREFRYPLNSWCIAFPAGLVEPGENLIEAIDRELREEVGCALRRDLGDPTAPETERMRAAVRPLPQAGFSSTGLTDETVQIVFTQVERIGEATPEDGELIEVFTLQAADVRAFLDENTTPIGTRSQLILELFAR